MTLYEKHRPRKLAEIIGQSGAVESFQRLIERGTIAGAYWILGESGTGKTTIARALCNELGIGDMDLFQVGGADCDVEYVRSLQSTFGLSTWGESGYKACIVDEAQAITPRAIQAWLPFLESLPAKRIVIFTSNIYKDDLFGDFHGAIFSRCKKHTLDLDLNAAAQHVAKIASDENLNGQPIEAYRALLLSCEGNIRAALQRVEQGEMLKCDSTFTSKRAAPVAVSMASLPNSIPTSKPCTSDSVTKISTLPRASSLVASDLAARIAAEIDFGKKFFAGSKKYIAHKARLAALQAETK